MTETEKQHIYEKRLLHQMQQAWIPQNIAEYFFYNEAGVLQIYEEQVKTL